MAHPAPFAVRQQLHYDITTMDVGTGSQVTRAVNESNTKRLRIHGLQLAWANLNGLTEYSTPIDKQEGVCGEF